MWIIHTFMQIFFVLESFHKPNRWGPIPAGTIVGPISEVHIVKILDEYGKEIAITSICKLWEARNLRCDIH